MCQGVLQRPDLALRPPDLVVKLVSSSLKLLLLLRGLDHVMSLAVLVLPLLLLNFVHHILIFALEVVDLLFPLCELECCLVPLVFHPTELGLEHVGVHLDLLLALLHADLQLLLPVFQAVQVLGLGVEVLPQPLDLEPEDVVLHEALLLLLHRHLHGAVHYGVLELKLLHGTLHALRVLLDRGQGPVGVLQLGVLPLDLCAEDAVEVLLLLQLLLQRFHLLVELLTLLHRALARHSRHLPLHQLGLEVHGIEKLLLPLPFLVKAADLELEVLDRGLGAADLAEGVRLVGPEAVELLALLVESVFGSLHLLLHHLLVGQHLRARLLRLLAPLVLVLAALDSVLQTSRVLVALILELLVLVLAQFKASDHLRMLVPRVCLLSLASTELVSHHLDFILEASHRALDVHMVQTDADKLPICLLDGLLHL
mmetsp:Transcript_1837/g.4960  ORF Transcript_1837/g.4960 Transcript_1837/m.4960 type:complete len:425 (-) Transcript_1837:810-2084(-)